MKQTLWTKNFSLLITATTLGCIGNIISSFALSFLVFDETGSTFASALVIAIQLIPNFLIPLLAAPWMDRLPRKPFLVFGDLMNGILYALMGLYLLFFDFSYIGYLGYSLLLATLGILDELASYSKRNGTKRIRCFFHAVSDPSCCHTSDNCCSYGYPRNSMAVYRTGNVFYMCCTG